MQTEISNEIGLIPLQADTSLLKDPKKFSNLFVCLPSLLLYSVCSLTCCANTKSSYYPVILARTQK